MVTSVEGWDQYNQLANQLRAAISFEAKHYLSPGLSEFRFKEHGLDDVVCEAMNGIILGVTNESNEVKVIVETELGGENNFSLYGGQVSIVDLLGVLEQLESYGKEPEEDYSAL